MTSLGRFRSSLIAISLTALTGCATERLSGDQLARVAKDWALGIRASQIIPVYPLTEDLQPGDVFLVQTPVEEQERIYLEKGFLPLENMAARLHPRGYGEFYRGWPAIVDGELAPPRPWQFPTADGSADFARAPLAAFPTYNFSVSRSGGFSLALPVQSVPVGLNLLDTASANGTITLKDAYTYGLPARVLHDVVRIWSLGSRDYLKQFVSVVPAAGDKSPRKDFYLRVVNRVYLVKTVDVTLFANRASAADASAGVPGKVDLLNIGNGTEAAKRFDEVNKVLARASGPKADNAAVADETAGAPPIAAGGSVRVAMATSRSVSLVESFARPLVIGYLATDYRILPDGELDAPVSVLPMLEGRQQSHGVAVRYTGCDADCGRLSVWLGDKANVKTLTRWLEQQPTPVAIADLLTGDHADMRSRAVAELLDQ